MRAQMIRARCYSAMWSAVILSLTAGMASQAAAQPGAPPPPPPHAGPPPPAPVPIAIEAAPHLRRWGIGVHLGGLGITSEREDGAGEARTTDLGLAGVQLRFRLHRRWELELGLTHMQGELPGPGETVRSSGAITLGGMFHINPDSRWLWSALVGIGGVRDHVWTEKDGDRVTRARFAEGMFRLGAGLERRHDRWGLAAQLFAVGLERNDDELDGPDYIGRDGPVPERSSGGMLQIVASYYF
jgi:hypothetical protein